VHLFSLSLTGNVFSWFASLPINSIRTREQLEQKFHDHFYNRDNELRLSHLTLVRQKHDELVTIYIRKCRETKNHCYNLVISEMDLAELAFNGLLSHIREKLEGREFIDVAQVLVRSLARESRSKDTRLKSDRPNMHMLDYESSDNESKEVCAAEFTWLPMINKTLLLPLSWLIRVRMRRNLLLMGVIVIKYLMSYLSRVKLRCLTLYHLLIN
jgi:hypothetical protein